MLIQLSSFSKNSDEPETKPCNKLSAVKGKEGIRKLPDQTPSNSLVLVLLMIHFKMLHCQSLQ